MSYTDVEIVDSIKQILDTELTDDNILSYVQTAENVLNASIGNSNMITEAMKDDMVRWLSAHLITTTKERQATKEKVGRAEIAYTGSFSHGLDSTSYGQQLKMLDITGELNGYLNKRQISMEAL